jgi:hypothetical protein
MNGSVRLTGGCPITPISGFEFLIGGKFIGTPEKRDEFGELLRGWHFAFGVSHHVTPQILRAIAT